MKYKLLDYLDRIRPTISESDYWFCRDLIFRTHDEVELKYLGRRLEGYFGKGIKYER